MIYQTGDIVLYARPNGGPLWPSVLWTETMLPNQKLRDQRGLGLVPIILLYRHDVRWALPSQIESSANVWYTEEEASKNPGLRIAYEEMLQAAANKVSVEHWKQIIYLSYGSPPPESQGLEEDVEPEVEAVTSNQARKRRSSTTSSSADSPGPKRRRTKAIKETDFAATELDQGGSTNTNVDIGETARVVAPSYSSAAKFDFLDEASDSDFDETLIVANTKEHGDSAAKTANLAVQLEKRRWAGLENQVRFVVGKQEEHFYIPYEKVKLHFEEKDYHGGLINKNFDDSDYTFDRTRLRKILPADFEFVKQYILYGQFGANTPTSQEEREKLFAQCCGAWNAGEHLGMTDLLEHVTGRIQCTKPWDPLALLHFAAEVYESSDFSFVETHKTMGDLLSSYIAENFATCMEDASAMRKFRTVPPQLKRDVQEKQQKSATPEKESACKMTEKA